MKLAVISHTPHYLREGIICGWGPTVRELNHLTEIFREIVHLAPLHKEAAPASSMSYTSEKISFIPLKPYGGDSITEKLSIATTAPHNLRVINSMLESVDWVQFRAPTAMGLYVLPFLAMKPKPKRWVKYAGNWIMEDPPYSYALQKWILEKNYLNCKVTINGWWKGQARHILSFPNPCLDDDELSEAKATGMTKDFSGKLKLCFVGTLTANKGAGLILSAMKEAGLASQVDEVVFAGGGDMQNELERQSGSLDVKTKFKGFVERPALKELYSASHIIILPSKSEGFPKVIAEASAYGCVPVVSDVSSISQYFGSDEAFLLKDISADGLKRILLSALEDRAVLKSKSEKSMAAAEQFTYSNYNRLLKEKILFE